MARFGDWYPHFAPSVPRKAKGGIKARSQRGAFGESWWARRWIAVLESFEMGARLQRGRRYARSGQVLEVAIDTGVVRARVQGSRPNPYAVTVRVKPLPVKDWARVLEALGREARFAARLLAGEMPEDIESAFSGVRLSLFPERHSDLATECSCPDWANPCKHVAAVYYLLGEEFDRDPFLVFKLRGMAREELVRRLGASHAAEPPQTGDRPAAGEPQAAEPLRADPAAFWSAGELPGEPFGEVAQSVGGSALLSRLGRFPFWRGSAPLPDALVPVYAAAAGRALDVFLGLRRG